MKKLITAVVSLLAAGAALAQPAATRLTLGDAFQRALEKNPSLLRAQADVRAADALRKMQFDLVMPHVSASGSLIENSENVTFGSGQDARTILPQNDWNYRVTVQQPVFAGLREQRAYTQAKIGVLNAKEATRSTEDQLLLRVAADYLGVVEGDELIAVEQKNIELAQKRLQQSRNFYEAGEVTQVDVLRAESAIKAAQRRLAVAQQLRDTAAGKLRIDLSIDTPVAVENPGIAIPAPGTEETLIARAEASRPEMQTAQNNIRIAQLEVSKQRGAYWPVVTADASWISQKASFPADQYGQAALRFSVPIFQSGELGQRVAYAKEREIQARLMKDEIEQNIREDVRKALLDLNAAETTLGLAREQLQASEAEYQQIFELYQAQEVTSLDLQAAESSLAEARRQVASGELDYELAQLRVWFAAGDIKSVGITEEKH